MIIQSYVKLVSINPIALIIEKVFLLITMTIKLTMILRLGPNCNLAAGVEFAIWCV